MLCAIFIVTRSSIHMSNPCEFFAEWSLPEGGVEKRLDGRYTLSPVFNASFVITGAPAELPKDRFVFAGRFPVS